MVKIGLYLCECGPNILDAIDLDHISEEITKDDTVATIERHKLLCSVDGKKFLKQSLEEHSFDRIVIAACSPKQHEATFMEVMSSAGMNPYLMQMVNIREQCAWVTPDKQAATQKALTSIRAAVDRVKHHQALEKREIECNPAVIIIGGGIAGIVTALRTAQPNRPVYLLEENELGGMLSRQRTLLPDMEPAREFLKNKIDALRKNNAVTIYEHCRIEELLGFFGNFVARVQDKETHVTTIKAGAVVLALDNGSYRPADDVRLGYGTIDNVYTAKELENKAFDTIKSRTGSEPLSVGIVHCVGREQLGYCSKMCCINSMKIARDIKAQIPGAMISQFYKHLCLPGTQYESFYHETKKQGVEFIRYEDIKAASADGSIDVTITASGNETTHRVDILILSTGMVPSAQVSRFAEMFNIPVDEYGYLKQEHNILEPIATVTEGVYITSGVQGPGILRDTLCQAGAAAGKILSSLVPGKRLELETKTSHVSETMCRGCGICTEVCAYGAVTLDEARHISVVNEVLCRGCGNCAAACPSGAALHRHFTNRQIFQEMNQIVKSV